LHDAIAAERVGTPAVGIMTTRFANAAELMASVLGMPAYEFATIEHPVSSASDEDLRVRARATLDPLRSLLLLDSNPAQ